MGESTAHRWKSKLQINFTWTNTVRILCLWFQIQCKFWILKSKTHGRLRLILPKALFLPPHPTLGLDAIASQYVLSLKNINQAPVVITPSSTWGKMRMSQECYQAPSPLFPPRLAKRNIFLCFWPPSSSFFPRFSLSLFFLFLFFFVCKITVILDSKATETRFSNLVKLYWWFNIQPILLHAHWMTREKLDHKHFFFFF